MDTCICLSMKNSVILSNDKFACLKKFVHEKKNIISLHVPAL